MGRGRGVGGLISVQFGEVERGRLEALELNMSTKPERSPVITVCFRKQAMLMLARVCRSSWELDRCLLLLRQSLFLDGPRDECNPCECDQSMLFRAMYQNCVIYEFFINSSPLTKL